MTKHAPPLRTAFLLVALLLAGAGSLVMDAPMARSRSAPQAPSVATALPTETIVPVGGRIQAENACYVRLPSMPAPAYGGPGRYGQFAGFNPDSGVLVAAGGIAKEGIHSMVYYQMYAMRLDSPAATWREILYPSGDGYQRGRNKGCREMASIAVTNTLSVSLLGKNGCDNGELSGNGDVRGVRIGETPDEDGVGFVPGMSVSSAPEILTDNRLGLIYPFATYDSARERVIFGQGGFSTGAASSTRPEVYEALGIGSQVTIRQLFPDGPRPERRYGSCGAYVRNDETGLEGVLVLGGNRGGPPGTTVPFDEVWWLDLADSRHGRWEEITDRFSNQAALGPRYEGACAYDAESGYFYTWLGHASPSIPDGAGLSSGAWRAALGDLADPSVPLRWERLAKDDLEGFPGRRRLPSVWDARNKRMLVLGGRIGKNEFDVKELRDVWAIYPDVTGPSCATLDPYAPYAPALPSPTPPPLVQPTATPLPLSPEVCPGLDEVVPSAVVASALANPDAVQGWGQLQNPGLEPSAWNPYRTRLGLASPSRPYQPRYNDVLFKASCP